MIFIKIKLARHQLQLHRNKSLFQVYPVAIGKPSTPTPIGTYTIINKVPHPGGPFGAMWLGLSIPHYGIHGTNNPSSIGKSISNGCIRMFNLHVVELSKHVAIGTKVIIEP